MKKDFVSDLMPDRMKSVSALMKQVLSEIVFREIKDPRVGSFLTIMDVQVSRDLRTARVYISSIDDSRDINLAVKGLTSASGFIRRRVAKEVSLRRIPDFFFYADTSIKNGVEMCNLIDGLRENDVDRQEPGTAAENIETESVETPEE